MVSINQNLSSSRSLSVGSFTPLEYDIDIVKQGSVTGVTPASDLYENKQVTATGSGVWNKPIFGFPLDGNYTLESMTPETAIVNGTEVSIVGAGGQCIYKVERDGIKSFVYLNNATTSQVVTYFNGYVEGTAARLMSDAILDLITGTEDMNLFTNWTGLAIGTPAPTLVRNTNCWAKDIDLSGVPVATTLKGYWGSENKGVLVTPRHVVGALHWNGYAGGVVGMKFRLFSVDNVIHERTVIGIHRGPDDFVTFTLDSDVPSTVHPIKVIGPWFARNRSAYDEVYDSYNAYIGGTFFYVDQTYSCRLTSGRSFYGLYPSSGLPSYTYEGTVITDFYQTANFLADTSFYSQIPAIFNGKQSYFREGIIGDSGSPVMALVNGEPAVVCTWLSGQHGPFMGNGDGALINRMIELADANAGVSTGYTVTVAPDPTLKLPSTP